MKKLSLLIALCMLISIGGVYAVWTYAGDAIGSVERTLSAGISAAVSEGVSGYVEFVGNSIDIKIEPTQDTINYTAMLAITGEVNLKFTPRAGFDDSSLAKVKGVLSLDNVEQYEGKDIYVLDGSEITLDWQKQTDGTYTATITAAQIENLLKLGGNFVLNTAVKHADFARAETNIDIHLTIQSVA